MIIEIFLIIIALQILFFIPAFLLKTDKLTDLTYSLTFIIVASILLYSNYSLPNLLLFSIILIWALRLLAYLFIRINVMGRDKRFDDFRHSLIGFGWFWIFQGLVAFLLLLPSIFYFNSEVIVLNYVSYLGGGIFLFGLIYESVADYQKFVFKLKKENKNKFIKSGVWKESRHPNYLGEILVWIGIYLFILPTLDLTQSIISLISPLTIYIALRYYSGIPLLEEKYNKRYKNNKEYKEYKKNTPLLFPKISRL